MHTHSLCFAVLLCHGESEAVNSCQLIIYHQPFNVREAGPAPAAGAQCLPECVAASAVSSVCFGAISERTILESRCPREDEWKGFRLLTDGYGSHCNPLLIQDNRKECLVPDQITCR